MGGKKSWIQLFLVINTHGQRNLYFINSLSIFNQRTYYQTTYLKRYLST